MKNLPTPKLCFELCRVIGFSLLFVYWIKSGETVVFFLFLLFIVMSLLRWRIPKLKMSVLADFAVCVALSAAEPLWGGFLLIPLLEAMYMGLHGFAIIILYSLLLFPPYCVGIFALVALCGFLLYCWEFERKQRQLLRDAQAGRYYELESLQGDLVAALAQIEQMTVVHERSRISRDIHDNAGHEIVAAYMSLQAIRDSLVSNDPSVLELYDSALERLQTGTEKIREAVHNLSTVNFLGVERLQEKCRAFSFCPVDFRVYGDTTHVPIYVWSMLESCLSEALTNITRHSCATCVAVQIDATPHIVRLCITNDGVTSDKNPSGSGLRNLRHRASAIGGSLSIDVSEVFSVVCVVPIHRGEKL